MSEAPAPPPAEFADTEAAASFLAIPAATLITLRSRGGGPPFIRVGRSVRYAYTSLREWMTSHAPN